MAPDGVEDLFYITRIPDGVAFFLFLIYLPIGALLCIIRILFCVQLLIILSILPKGILARKWILKICGCILGIISYSQKDERNSSSKSNILVSNSISELDSLVIELVESHMLVSRSSSLPSLISWLMGYKNYENSHGSVDDKLKNCINRTDINFPVLVFPEESSTNGKVSMLKFSNAYFQLHEAYQPIVLTAKRPSLLPIKVSVLTGGFWSDLLWTFFVPYTLYEIRYLPQMERAEASSVDDFAKSVCKEMCDSLGLKAAQYDASDKKELIKRMQHVQPEVFQKQSQPFASSLRKSYSSQSNSKLENMIRQVKDVLPQVPIDVVRRDLAKSKSVDATLTNLLEGKIMYIPLSTEEIEDEKRQQEIKKAEALKKSSFDMKSKNQKGLSFYEKKKLMIEEARKNYLEKHPEFAC